MTVAQPAPATPILNVRINTKSSIILIILAIIKNTSGVLLSPSERSILENKLKNTAAAIPSKITIM